MPEASAGHPEPMLRASWMWTGGGSTDAWTNAQNWSGAGGACVYPCSSADDVLFQHLNFTAVFDASRTIDDLTALSTGENSVTGAFASDGNARTLTCDTVIITGGQTNPTTISAKYLGAVETD
ncbi:MAG: hypothetical protein AMXMBFR22_14160 [Phycisphaerae bacterium]